MNRVQRAIILAAGKGARLRPLTLTTPKPLIYVNGMRMIDTVIRALHQNGIFEIYVVVGYLKDCFEALPTQYPGLCLIENPYFESCNNISSLYVAREHLSNSIILDGDQIIYSPSILEPGFGRSGYNAVWNPGETSEWLMQVSEGVVRSCSRTGGSHGWQLYSISRWSEEDGNRLRKHLEIEFEQRRNRQIYWDDVAMFCYPEQYCLGVREMRASDVREIDTLRELAEEDPSYQPFLDNRKEVVQFEE